MLCKSDIFKNTLINTNAHNCTYYLIQNRKQAKYVYVTYEHLSLCTFNTIKNRRNGKHQINNYCILQNPRKVPLSQKIIAPLRQKLEKFSRKKCNKNFFHSQFFHVTLINNNK